jgi:peptidyl-prolyl cis-trans isomerase B (cyclophilin B)
LTEINHDTLVDVETTAGTFTLALDSQNAPKSSANFLQYVEDDFFEDTIFHRVLSGQMGIIQGGGLTEDMKPKPGQRSPIENEADNGLSNRRGTISMARTSDPHSATSQFFISTSDNTFLDHTGKDPQGWGYAVFGEVVEGMDVVERINDAETTTVGPYADVPKDPVKIVKTSVR